MTIVFILFVLLAALLLLPTQQGAQTEALKDVKESLSVRMEQLKRDFQFRTKELARRLASADLAEDEWQKLTDELQLDTKVSIDSTEIASENHKSNSSWLSSIAMLSFVAVIALVSYNYSGSYEQAKLQTEIVALLKNDPQTIDKLSDKVQQEKSQQSLNDLYLALRSNVELLPTSIYSWRELAFFNSNYGRLEEARAAMNIALKIEPQNLDLKIDLAQILSTSKEKQDLFLSMQLISEVLKVEPLHQGALLLSGHITYQFGLYKKAISSWTILQKGFEPGSEMAEMLQQRIADAEALLSGKPVKTQSKASTAAASIKVKIQIPEAIRALLTGKEDIFIFAKAIDGVKFPLAVIKTSLSTLSEEVILSDENAMRPDVALSKFEQVKVTARISISGDVIAKAGDIEGESELILAPFNGKLVTLIVDQVLK